MIAAKSGRDIILTCPNKHDQLYCQWQRESSSSPYQFESLAKGNKYLNQDKAGMTIKQFSYVDGGRYRCICYNSGKRNIQRYSITVGKYILYRYNLFSISVMYVKAKLYLNV